MNWAWPWMLILATELKSGSSTKGGPCDVAACQVAGSASLGETSSSFSGASQSQP